jgi:hypothetical protein
VREYFTKYFISPQGCLPWQYDKVWSMKTCN